MTGHGSRGLFVDLLRRIGGSRDLVVREDFFTASLAEVLAQDQALARSFVVTLNGGRRTIGGIRISSAPIVVETQREFQGRTGARSRFDMILTIGSDFKIGCEHKLLAPLGENQLAKYLAERRVDRIAVISGYPTKTEGTSAHRVRYLRPPNGRSHFLWSDIYGLVAEAAARRGYRPLQQALLGLFEYLSFQPQHRLVGDLMHPHPVERERNRVRYETLFKPTFEWLKTAGFDPRTNVYRECWAYPPRAESVKWIWIAPWHIPGSLRVRIHLRSRSAATLIARHLAAMGAVRTRRSTVTPIALRQHTGSRFWAVDVLTLWSRLFAQAQGHRAASARLSAFVSRIAAAVNEHA